MAGNVFGTPVTGATKSERARKAFHNPNEEKKEEDAHKYVKDQKLIWGDGVSTRCIFYNATGENLTYSQNDSQYGKIIDSYPVTVENGQWGAFFHVATTDAASGSAGFVEYKVKFTDTEDFWVQVLCWQTSRDGENNHAYCDIFKSGRVDTADDIYTKMGHSGRQTIAIKKGMSTTVTIEEGTSPLFKARFTLANIEA